MKKNQKNDLVSWDDHLDKKYGIIGTPTRDKYEEDFENFKIGVLIQEARKQQNLTQEKIYHSERNDFTGFANAARTLWKLTVKNAMATAAKPAATNIHHWISMR